MQYVQELCLTSLLVNSILVGPHHEAFHFTWERLAQHKPTFDPNYNVEDAQLALQLSFMITDSHAYSRPLSIPEWLQSTELKYDSCPLQLISKGIPNSPYNDPAVVGQILYNPAHNVVFIVFVGTSNSCMGALDLAYSQVEYTNLTNYVPGLGGHRGVYAVYNSIRDKLLMALAPYLSRNPTILITGHSLGGALSQVCALDLAVYNPIHYSFAAPMVFNGVGYEIYTRFVEHSYRVANISDLVTISPLPIMPNKDIFYHVGKLVYFQRNLGTYAQNHTIAYAREFNLV